MANIWIDPVKNNENRVGVTGMPVKSSFLPTKSQSVKKQAFSELNNVIRNQLQTATPHAPPDVYPGVFSVSKSKSLVSEVLRKQQAKQNFVQAQQKLENAFKTRGTASQKVIGKMPPVDENLFEFWDLPSISCTAMCFKSDQEIWSEMNAFDDDILNKVLCGGDSDTDSKCVFEKDELHSLNDSDMAIMSSLDFLCPDADTNEEASITLPLMMPSISDFEDEDDMPF